MPSVVELELTGDQLLNEGRSREAHEQFAAALGLDPHLQFALLRDAQALLNLGERAQALERLQRANRPVAGVLAPYTGAEKPLRVLQLGSALVDGLTATDCVLCGAFCETTTIAVQYWDPFVPLPRCDLVFNSIADPDLCAPALDLAEYLLRDVAVPVVNAPDRVRGSGRADNALRLRGIPNLRVPRTQRLPREHLSGARGRALLEEGGFAPPLLLRSPGFHNGKHFERLLAWHDLPAVLERLPGEELLAIEYADGSRDGAFRKYRAMIVGGELYPAHLAISPDWKVHYFSAVMGEAERAEEARFLAEMPAAIGDRAMGALAQVARRLALDYAGIDFGLDGDGAVLLFEANAAMTVYVPEATAQTQYRVRAAERIFAAAQAMLRAWARS